MYTRSHPRMNILTQSHWGELMRADYVSHYQFSVQFFNGAVLSLARSLSGKLVSAVIALFSSYAASAQAQFYLSLYVSASASPSLAHPCYPHIYCGPRTACDVHHPDTRASPVQHTISGQCCSATSTIHGQWHKVQYTCTSTAVCNHWSMNYGSVIHRDQYRL